MSNEFADALAAVGFDAADVAKTPTELAAAAPAETAVEVKADDGLVKLEGDAASLNAGTFVLTGQSLASDEGFRNVSKLWPCQAGRGSVAD
jgi:hypothetical protein